MLKHIRKAMKQDGGFTLIELLIVIVILGVLAGIVVFSVSGITDRGKTSACKSDLATVNTAVEAYYAQKGTYPTQESDLMGPFLHGSTLPSDVNVTFNGANTAPTVAGVGCS